MGSGEGLKRDLRLNQYMVLPDMGLGHLKKDSDDKFCNQEVMGLNPNITSLKRKHTPSVPRFHLDLDQRIEAALGHFRKDFDGEISATKLGPKFGGYGTFLPVLIWSPSVLYKRETTSAAQKIRDLPKLNFNMMYKRQRCGGDYSFAGRTVPPSATT